MLESSSWNFHIQIQLRSRSGSRISVNRRKLVVEICDFNFAFAESWDSGESCIHPNNMRVGSAMHFWAILTSCIGIGDTWNWIRNISSGAQVSATFTKNGIGDNLPGFLPNFKYVYISVQITREATDPLSNEIYCYRFFFYTISNGRPF